MSNSYYDVESIGLGTVKKEAYNPYEKWDYDAGRPRRNPYSVYCNPIEIPNPFAQSLLVTWQEDKVLQYKVCTDYEEAWKVYQENFTKPYVKMVKSVVLSHTELESLARVEKVEKAEKVQRKLDEEELERLLVKLHPGKSVFIDCKSY